MKIEKKEAETLNNAIRFWEENQHISHEQATNLRNSFEVSNDSTISIARYAFLSALSCGVLAFGALVVDEKWVELLRKRWEFSETSVAVVFSMLSALFIYLAQRRKVKYPYSSIGNEFYPVTIALSVAVAVAYWSRSLGLFNGHYAQPLLLAVVTYAVCAIYLRSSLLWGAMLAAFVSWWVIQTYQWSGGSFRFAGMNYPFHLTLMGLVILGASLGLKKVSSLVHFHRLTYTLGLVLFLFSAWMLSIFGNYDSFDRWSGIKQHTLWYWSVGYTVLLAGLIAYAFRRQKELLREIVPLFFIANIYTRYFEYFWDRTNKGLFFAILALSFWWVGKKAEKYISSQ